MAIFSSSISTSAPSSSSSSSKNTTEKRKTTTTTSTPKINQERHDQNKQQNGKMQNRSSSPPRKLFPQLVYEKVKQVPAGKVTTYKDVAVALKLPNHARHVGFAMRDCDVNDVPWWRCVNSSGGISLKGGAVVDEKVREAEKVKGKAIATSSAENKKMKVEKSVRKSNDKNNKTSKDIKAAKDKPSSSKAKSAGGDENAGGGGEGTMSAALLQKKKLAAEGHTFSGKTIVEFGSARWVFAKD
ncbi:unnamed protein product [Amoebophrya sp. A120]|nr:unnamed protein product [Amoebophrya sp. A120]|eukprot:GSA120T00006969001.1